MRVAITGGTGLVGDAVRRAAVARGDEASVVSRTAGEGRIAWDTESGVRPQDALSDFSAVVHLAGAAVADGRWTAARKQELMESRRQGTRAIVLALQRANPRPSVLISASGIGYYGDGGDRELNEDAPLGDDFLAQICHQWEREAEQATELGVRVVRLRFGLVLAPKGGALAKMLPAFRLGVGGRIGSGRQYMAWVHIDDVTRVVLRAIDDSTMVGAYNVCAPNPVDNRTFTRALGAALGRPTIVPVPAFALRVAFGELATVLLTGQRAAPQRLLAAGFEFEHPELAGALADVLKP